MKNVVLVYGYGLKNAGDMAITEGAIDFLLSHNCSVKVVMRHNSSNPDFKESKDYLTDRYGKKIDIYESPFSLDRSDGPINRVNNYLDGILKLTGVRKTPQLNEIIRWSDYVFFDGGNLFRCEHLTDYARLKALFYPLKIANKLGKQFSILPQSASNINSMGRGTIEDIIKKAEYVFLREPSSFEKLKNEYASYSDKLFLSLDMAYLTDLSLDKSINVNNGSEKTVAFTIRAQTVGDLKDLNDTLVGKIEVQITETTKYLLDKGYKIKLISQCLKDDDITKKVSDNLGNNAELIFERNPERLRKLYSEVEFLVGMRLHSIIMAASVGTPSYGYFMKEWGLKNPGMMNLMNLPFTFADEDDISTMEIDSLIESRREYTETIKNRIKEYKGVLDQNLFD